MLGGLLRKSKRTPKAEAAARPVVVRARFDSAQTTPDNRRHWAAADGLAPNAAVSPEVRRVLRNRARYEVANNSYAKGIVLTLANDTVGTGPRLQMLTDNPEANARVEDAFSEWAAAVDLAGLLRTLRMGRAESGECFCMLTSSPRIDHAVKLDPRLLEPDQVTSPLVRTGRAGTDNIDGVVLDASGHPAGYYVLRRHPGDSASWTRGRNGPFEFDTVPAGSMIHYFRADRPGQRRGIPDITPALPLFAQLRRYTLAVIAAAETAADFAAVLYTDAPANGEADPLEPMDMVGLEKRLATVLPGGWKLGQIHAEQPATTYAEFKREILNEIARCLTCWPRDPRCSTERGERTCRARWSTAGAPTAWRSKPRLARRRSTAPTSTALSTGSSRGTTSSPRRIWCSPARRSRRRPAIASRRRVRPACTSTK